MITVASLVAAGIAPTQARLFQAPLIAACNRFDISTAARLSGFIAQCRIESRDFTALEESLYYTTPERIRAVFPGRVHSLQEAQSLARNPRALANRVYAGRLGNGDEASGDGWKFRGRGLKMITGRDHYQEASTALRRPYVDQPELVGMPTNACMTAAWFWDTIGGNKLADAGLWDQITRAVNGPGMLQADLRRQYSAEAITAFA